MFCKGFWQTIRNCKIFGRKAAIPISNLPPFFGSPNFAPFLESPPPVARIVAYVRTPPPPPPFQETGKVFTLYELKYCIVRISDLGFF